MRTRLLVLAFLAAASFAARADDTRPPSIADVKAQAKGGKVEVEARITDETGVLSAICHHRGAGGRFEDSPMQKDQYDDLFRASFSGGADTEYWIEATDLLGNGPSTQGSAGKPLALGGGGGKPSGRSGGAAVAQNDRQPKREAQSQPGEAAPKHASGGRHGGSSGGAHHGKGDNPPVIEHRMPSTQPPDGQEFTLRARIHGDAQVVVAGAYTRAKGAAAYGKVIPLKSTEGDSYEGKIPGELAHGTLEYLIAAKDANGKQTMQGNGSDQTPYTITFKGAADASGPATVGPFHITHNPPARVPPGKPVFIRAQIVQAEVAKALAARAEAATDEPAEGVSPDKAMVLWRGNDGNDQATELSPDSSGGLGGYKAQLPPQSDGALYYQIVACNGAKCSVDTGSKKRWHAATVADDPGKAPLPLEATSSKAPAGLPE